MMGTGHDVRELVRDEGALLRRQSPGSPRQHRDREHLDPPFNSNATYNVLFRSPRGEESGRDRMRGRTAACSQDWKCRKISNPEVNLQLIAPPANRELFKSRFAKARKMNTRG